MKLYKGKISTGLLFVLFQTILYGAFLTLDLTGGSIALSNKIKFCMIILCFCYVLFLKKSSDRSIILCLQVAIFFTVISDLFILILDYYFYGVLTFIIVQQLYGVRLILVTKRILAIQNSFRTYLIRLLIQAVTTISVCLILQYIGVQIEGLLVATVFYFMSLLTNVVTAVKIAFANSYEKSDVLFGVGMVLFLLCDINVGLFNLSSYVFMPNDLYELIYSYSSILMWTFYAPSQVFIALSAKRK